MIIDNFNKEFEFLSNFYPSEIKIEGITFPTVEHAFQALKSLDITERVLIAAEPTPGRAKRAGRRVKLRPDWEEVKVNYMYECVKRKFEIPELKRKLLATGDAYLIEGNTWNDTFWGVCNGEGANMLGLTLMKVRSELKAKET